MRGYLLLQSLVAILSMSWAIAQENASGDLAKWEIKIESQNARAQTFREKVTDHKNFHGSRFDQFLNRVGSAKYREKSNYFERVDYELKIAQSQVLYLREQLERMKSIEKEKTEFGKFPPRELLEDEKETTRTLDTQLLIIKNRLDYVAQLVSLWEEYETGRYRVNDSGQCMIHGVQFSLFPSEFQVLADLSDFIEQEDKKNTEGSKQSELLASEAKGKSDGKKDAKAVNLAEVDPSKLIQVKLAQTTATPAGKGKGKDTPNAEAQGKFAEKKKLEEMVEFSLDDADLKVEQAKLADQKQAKKDEEFGLKKEKKDKLDPKAGITLIEEKKRLLEKVKNDLANKAPLTKAAQKRNEQTLLTKEDQAAIANKTVRGKGELITAAQDTLRDFKSGTKENLEFGDFFLETEFHEKGEKLDRSVSQEKFQKLYSKWFSSKRRYEQIVKDAKGSNEEKILAVTKALNDDYLFQYVRDNAHLLDILGERGGNCVAETKFIAAVIKDLGLKTSPNTTFSVQVFDDHIQPVLYHKTTREVTSLVNGSKIKDLIAPVYHPEVLVHQYLVTENQSSPAKYEDFLIQDIPQDVREKAKEALAQAEIQMQKQGLLKGLLDRASFGTNSSLNFPKSGVFFAKDGGFNPPPRNAWIDWAEGASFQGNALDFYGSASIDPRAWASGNFEEYEPPAIQWDKARHDMAAIVENPSFKDYLKFKSDPTLFATGSYDEAKVKEFRTLQEKVYKILDGKEYVSGKNATDGYSTLRRKVGKENPQLLALYELTEKERSRLTKSGADGDREKEKYFDFFKLVGAKRWNTYKELQEPLANEHLLAEALGKPSLPYTSLSEIDRHFSQDEKVAYLTTHKREVKSENKKSTTDEKLFHRGYKKQNEGDAKEISAVGYGKDPKGIKFKPEKEAPTKLDALTFAQYAQSVDPKLELKNATTNPGDLSSQVFSRWTPGLTAALREDKRYTKDFVEWFANGGYRDVAKTRKEETLLISGPDKKSIPKDLAVLLVDFIGGKDETSADKVRLTTEIEKNYGSVQNYLTQVKVEFDNKKEKLPELAKKDEKGSDSNSLDVFKKIAKDKGIDVAVFDRAAKKSFDYKYRAPETFKMGSPPSENGHSDQENLHEVTLSKGYNIQLTHVTQLQWYLVMDSNPSKYKETEFADGDHVELKGTQLNVNHPVETASWEDAKIFIGKLNKFDGRCTYRLPTEAEWEAAARAKTNTAYSFGNDPGANGETLRQYAWFWDNNNRANQRTHAVASLKPNPEGLYDMHGNVWNWVEDWYSDTLSSATDPVGPSAGSYRVLRGGSWDYYPVFLRSAFRGNALPGNRYVDVGLRLVRTCP